MNFCFDHWELEETFTYKEPQIRIPSCSSSGSGSSSSSSSSSNSSKKVKYAKTCAVILIPSREEYFDAGINLWYDRKDLKLSQYQASIELKHLMEENPVLTMEAAMTYLYQPKIEIFYENMDCWFHGRNLNLLVVDRNTENANDTINDVISSQKNWKWSSCVAPSGESALQMIKNGAKSFDIVLIDESVGGKGSFSFSALVTIFRSVFGDSVFIGCTMSDPFDGINVINCTANASKMEALKAGCDFVWKRPISKFARMLPILLATRNKPLSEIITAAANSTPTPPTRNRSSERSLASLDGLRDLGTDDNDYDEYEDTFAGRIKGLLRFHDEFELKSECPSVGLELENIPEKYSLRGCADSIENKMNHMESRMTEENIDLDNIHSSDQNGFVDIDYKSDTSDRSGSTTGNNSVSSSDKEFRNL